MLRTGTIPKYRTIPKHRDSSIHAQRDLDSGIDPVSMAACIGTHPDPETCLTADWCPAHDPEEYSGVVAKHRSDKR